MDRSRLEAFSDGVFAVAITLLALNLAVAGPGTGSLLDQLGRHWPAFVAYVISFFTIGIIWVNHHALVRNIAVVDRTLLFVNLLLLLFVVAIPFVTATMADYLTGRRPGRARRDGTVRSGPRGHVARLPGDLEWTLRDGRTLQPRAASRPQGRARAVLRRPDPLPDRRCAWPSSARRSQWRLSGWSPSTTSSSAPRRRPGPRPGPCPAGPQTPMFPISAVAKIDSANRIWHPR